MKCPNHAAGCEWKGTLGHSVQHCDCLRLSTAQILKEVVTGDCNKASCKITLTESARNVCTIVSTAVRKMCSRSLLVLVTISNSVTGTHCGMAEIPREIIEKHRKKYPNEVLPCKFHNIGRTKMVQRKLLQDHLETNEDQHFDQALTKMAELSIQFKGLEERLANLEQQNAGW